MANQTSSTGESMAITVSLPDGKITVLENGTAVREITSFSTGRPGHLTPLVSNGKILGRERIHHSNTYKDSHGKPAAMPFALFFSKDGCAFHAGDPNVESHGCIHLTAFDAEWLFKWVGQHDVAVTIVGPNPKVATTPHP
jgi:lipoprotein-anchoring transpeptidase ErfK/SrfK